MNRRASLAFKVKRSNDVFGADAFTTTKETVHGLLILNGEELIIQSRKALRTDVFGGMEMKSEEKMDPVREVVIPLTGVAGSLVKGRWWTWPGPRLVLRAADLRAFEEVVGEEGISLGHPGELVLPVRRRDLLSAEEFAAELALALAEMMTYPGQRLPAAPPPDRLPSPSDGRYGSGGR